MASVKRWQGIGEHHCKASNFQVMLVHRSFLREERRMLFIPLMVSSIRCLIETTSVIGHAFNIKF